MNRLDGRMGEKGEGKRPPAPRVENEVLEGALKGIVRLFVQGNLCYRAREARVETSDLKPLARRLWTVRGGARASGAARTEEPVEAK